MTDNLKTWPERIYLQAGDDYDLMPYEGMDGMSWCEYPIFNHDVQYVRADLVGNEALREALQIGLKWARSYCTHPADDHPDVCKIEAAIASLPTIKDCLHE